MPVNRQELHLRGKYSACLRLRDTGIKRPFTGPLYTMVLSAERLYQKDYSAGGHEREAADEELHPWHARCGHVYGLSADR